MHFSHAFIIAYFVNVFMAGDNVAFDLSYGHRKRELNFNNYPANNAVTNPGDGNNNSQQNQLNDPGYTKQHENDDLKKMLNDKNTNSSNAQNWLELLNPSGQMFHVIYMLPNPQKRELGSMSVHEGDKRQQIKGADENLAYAGPHLFPIQFDENQQQNIQQHLNLPFKNFNNALPNAYSNPLLVPQYYQNFIKDSKVATKMEAPFVASQFLGYDQNQRQHMPQQQQLQFASRNQQLQTQQQQIPQQRQHMPAQNQLLAQLNPMLLSQPQQQQHQQQPVLKTPPVYEHHVDLPFKSSNLIYMSPNNIYNLYRKPN